MTAETLNNVIADICKELNCGKAECISWKDLNEKELLYEMVVCIAGSQMLYEMSIGIADRLIGKLDFIMKNCSYIEEHLEKKIKSALSEYIWIRDINGNNRKVKIRFKNRIAKLISKTICQIYGNNLTIRQILEISSSPDTIRKEIIRRVSGFGPKQASLYLRRIGFASNLAVIDVHIMDYLKIATDIKINSNRIASIREYEKIENEYRNVVASFGQELGCIDLATWITMRAAKQEAFI